MTINIPRGIRNHNPGNIRWGDDWRGLVTASQRNDTDFCQFNAPEYGIRAMILILRCYQRHHGLHTLSGIIPRWAPLNENNTHAYLCHVADEMGISPEQRVDITDSRVMLSLVQAMILHENGSQPYEFGVLVRALDLAGH